MCWSNDELIPIVLTKPLKVYKVGVVHNNTFTSTFKKYVFIENQLNSTIKLVPNFRKLFRYFRISEGYHAYLSLDKAMSVLGRSWDYLIGVFEIPKGATVYINFSKQDIISSDIKYLYPIE